MAQTFLNLAQGVTGTLPTGNYVQGGITEADTWRITTNFQGNTTPITANWERDDAYLNGNMGTGMTQSSGVFSFPSTGFYLVTFNMQFSAGGADNDYILNAMELTTNNSSYDTVSFAYASIVNNSAYQGACITKKILDITDVANQKVRFKTSSQDNNHYVQTSSTQNATYAMFIKLGDT